MVGGFVYVGSEAEEEGFERRSGKEEGVLEMLSSESRWRGKSERG